MRKSKQISSVHNPLIKKVVLLKEKSRERKKTGIFVLEGQRELQLAIKGKYELDTVFYYPDLIDENQVDEILKNSSSELEVIETSKEVHQKIAYRETTEGIVALVKSKSHLLEDLKFSTKKPLILVAEAPEKPGNIGALLRTADAANLDAVIIANPKGDLYNPNIIRSSVGGVFTNTIAIGSTKEVIAFLKSKEIDLYCAALTASKPYTEIDFKKSAAIIVGTEATGLSNEWLQNSTQNIVIPMQGVIDSMNVSVAAAILIFEAKRQRKS